MEVFFASPLFCVVVDDGGTPLFAAPARHDAVPPTAAGTNVDDDSDSSGGIPTSLSRMLGMRLRRAGHTEALPSESRPSCQLRALRSLLHRHRHVLQWKGLLLPFN